MAKMSYRRLDDTGDYIFGHSQQDFLTDIDAVAQAIKTRLFLFYGEWWLDQRDGLPLWQKMLGSFNGHSIKILDRFISERILGTPNVTGIASLTSSFNPNTRQYTFSATVNTAFGQVAVTNGGGV